MIAIGSDHAGFPLKEEIKKHLEARGLEFKDVGTDSTASCDYPVYSNALCEEILSGNCDKGIIICGTGIGVSIVANRHKGIRCALCTDSYMARLTREHNDANVLAMGARVIGPGVAEEIVDVFLDTPFSEGKNHVRRIGMMD